MIIVAFGDSLTVGHRSFGNAVPYSSLLKSMISQDNRQVGKEFEIEIYNRGINGDLTEGMLRRFERDVLDIKAQFVIILGGTNDIGWGIPVQEIFENLRKMFTKALENGIEPIACTIPSILGFDELISPRIKLNQTIKRYCVERNLSFADLFAATSDPTKHRLLKEYSDDGLHLTEQGYRRITEEIFTVFERKLLSGAK